MRELKHGLDAKGHGCLAGAYNRPLFQLNLSCSVPDPTYIIPRRCLRPLTLSREGDAWKTLVGGNAHGRAVQVDSINTRVERAYAFSA